MNRLLWMATFLLAATTISAGERTPEPQLPLRSVVLYTNGVGYFERSGNITGNQPLSLRFRTSQMDDVLKSLTAIDLTHGSVSIISFPGSGSSTDDIYMEFKQGWCFADFLSQFEGAAVQLRVANVTIDGTIMGVEWTETESGESSSYTDPRVIIIQPKGEIRRLRIADIGWIGFSDARLNEDIRKHLSSRFAGSAHTLKEIKIFSKVQSDRQMLVAYTLNMPRWKATYRLVLTDDDSALLQGWALVENSTEEDWKDVQLALISGQPYYRRAGLYSYQWPGYVFGGGGWDGDLETFMLVKPVELAELFRYDIDHPVSIQRNDAALLPITNRKVEAKRVSLYRAADQARTVDAAVRIANGTGLTLEKGAVAVFDSNTFAGDGWISLVKPGERAYISHGVDLGTDVSVSRKATELPVHRVRFYRGSMIAYHRTQKTALYTFSNRDAREKTIVVEHRADPERHLTGRLLPIERDGDLYRYEALLPARGKTEIPVHEEERHSTAMKVDQITAEDIARFVRHGYIDKEVENALKEIVALREELDVLTEEVNKVEATRSGIFNNQQRLRENLQVLGATPAEEELRERYIRILDEEESSIRTINTNLNDLKKQLMAGRHTLVTAIRQLDREYEVKREQ